MMYIKGIENIEKLKGQLTKLPEAFGEEAKAYAESLTPSGPTGKLKESWVLKVFKRKIELTNNATNEQGVPYAPFVEFGTAFMRGVFMLTRTVKHAPELLKRAKQKVGL
jgi:hypothetical protein